MFKRGALIIALLVALAPRAWGATCTITGQVLDAVGNPIVNGQVQFNSIVQQSLPGGAVPPSFVTAPIDTSGNVVIAITQGLQGQMVFCQSNGGVCGAATPVLIPLAPTAMLGNVLAGNQLTSGAVITANLSVTNNLAVGGSLQVTGPSMLSTVTTTGNLSVGGALSLTGNLAVPGTLGVTGTSTLGVVNSGAITAPSINLTNTNSPPPGTVTTSAITLGGGVITSGPNGPGLLNSVVITSGMHPNPNGLNWIADSPNPLLYHLDPNTGSNMAGHVWYLDNGLTVGNAFSPTVSMALVQNGSSIIPPTPNSTLYVGGLNLDSQATAIQLNSGALVSAGTPNMNVAAGQHFNGSAWIADNATTMLMSESNGTIAWWINTAQVPGGVVTNNEVFQVNPAGMSVIGTNPVQILTSLTNANSDLLEVFPANHTQGIGIGWDEIHSIGNNPSVFMDIDAKGGGDIGLNVNNPTGRVVLAGHLIHNLEGAPGPGISGGSSSVNCGAGATIVGGSTDTLGAVTLGGGLVACNCVVAFGQTFASAPLCFAQPTNGATSEFWSVGTSPTQLTVTCVSASNLRNFVWWCPSHS